MYVTSSVRVTEAHLPVILLVPFRNDVNAVDIMHVFHIVENLAALYGDILKTGSIAVTLIAGINEFRDCVSLSG